MTFRILLLLAWTAWIAPAQESACRSVEGDRIRMQDVAAALPEFLSAPQDTVLSPSPLPGTQRAFHLSELQTLARRFGITLAGTQDVCFEWALQPLDRARVLAAMQESLEISGAKIEIADMFSARVPTGRIEFAISRLGTPAATGPRTSVLWPGDVIYGDNHRFAIWARVSIAAPCQRLVAAESLKAGQPIVPSQVRESSAQCFPTPGKEILTLADVAGRVPLRAISAGGELRPDLLAAANDINRGDAVRIEVHSGAARLAFTARALSAGRTGETILLRNPDSNRTFSARITGKGTALVDAGNSKGI